MATGSLRAVFGALVLAVGAVSAAPPAEAQEAESREFPFGSFENHGDFEHCVARLRPLSAAGEVQNPDVETCFESPVEAIEYALVDSVGPLEAAALAGPVVARQVVPNGLIAIHYALPNFEGASLTLAGADCAGGGITLTGGHGTTGSTPQPTGAQ